MATLVAMLVATLVAAMMADSGTAQISESARQERLGRTIVNKT